MDKNPQKRTLWGGKSFNSSKYLALWNWDSFLVCFFSHLWRFQTLLEEFRVSDSHLRGTLFQITLLYSLWLNMYLTPHIKVYLGLISGMNVTFCLFSRNLSFRVKNIFVWFRQSLFKSTDRKLNLSSSWLATKKVYQTATFEISILFKW